MTFKRVRQICETYKFRLRMKKVTFGLVFAVEEGRIFVFLSKNGSLPTGNVTLNCGSHHFVPCTTYAVRLIDPPPAAPPPLFRTSNMNHSRPLRGFAEVLDVAFYVDNFCWYLSFLPG